jgi:hypothetical protein
VHLPERAEHTALSRDARVFICKTTFDGWQPALVHAASLFSAFRGKLGKPYGSKDPPGPDHDLVYDFVRSGRIRAAPRRSAFGLPHDYQLLPTSPLSPGRGVGVGHVQPNDCSRAAAPRRRSSGVFVNSQQRLYRGEAMNEVNWQDLILALMHDPPDKALSIKGHVPRARDYAQAVLGPAVSRKVIEDAVSTADPLAAAAERLPCPSAGEHGERAVNVGDKGCFVRHPLAADAATQRNPGSRFQ